MKDPEHVNCRCFLTPEQEETLKSLAPDEFFTAMVAKAIEWLNIQQLRLDAYEFERQLTKHDRDWLRDIKIAPDST